MATLKKRKRPSRTLGRPTKYLEATVNRLCEALADGMAIKGACVVAGIGVTTLGEWREKRPEIEERLDEAREVARQKALQAIKAAGEKDWRAWAEWLRLTFPADYRGSGNKIEVQQAVQIRISQEQLEDLRRRLPDARVLLETAEKAFTSEKETRAHPRTRSN